MVSIEKIFPAEGRKLLLQSRTPGIIYQTRMMNAVEWLAPFRFPPEGGIEYIPPENMEPLALLLKRNSDAALLEEILETLERTSACLEGYLLDADKLWWDPEWIFYDRTERKVRMVYIPWDINPGDNFPVAMNPGVKDTEKPEEATLKVNYPAESLCRFLWRTAALAGWSDDAWVIIGRFSRYAFRTSEVKSDRSRRAMLDPVREKALDDLMGQKTLLPALKTEETAKKPGLFAWLKKLFHRS